MKWIYRHKKEDFAHAAQKLNVALEGRLDDMRKEFLRNGERPKTPRHLGRAGSNIPRQSITHYQALR